VVPPLPILSVEDPLAEDDGEGMRSFHRARWRSSSGDRTTHLVTSAARIAARTGARVNAVLLKPNQAGTVTETAAARGRASGGWTTVISARSGETEDDDRARPCDWQGVGS
jgi:enolase